MREIWGRVKTPDDAAYWWDPTAENNATRELNFAELFDDDAERDADQVRCGAMQRNRKWQVECSIKLA